MTEDPEVRKLLDMHAEGDAIFGPILLGHPKADPPRPPKKEPKVKWM